ncbi:hypothetical protein J6590_059973 [Homalodisca vitripennis]|nr:hypothetical protein J6590_059973 [Homalodisca vitripennis]
MSLNSLKTGRLDGRARDSAGSNPVDVALFASTLYCIDSPLILSDEFSCRPTARECSLTEGDLHFLYSLRMVSRDIIGEVSVRDRIECENREWSITALIHKLPHRDHAYLESASVIHTWCGNNMLFRLGLVDPDLRAGPDCRYLQAHRRGCELDDRRPYRTAQGRLVITQSIEWLL